VEPVSGVVQHYPWGDPDAIPRLLGTEPDGRPWAELWLGTHPSGHATVAGGRRLVDASGELPYLLKVLAAAAPLSLQAHPDPDEARHGFAREEADGPPQGAQERIYRDPKAKPELIVALTEFDALCGFRPVRETVDVLRGIGAKGFADLLLQLGLGATVAAVYRGGLDGGGIVEACRRSQADEARLVVSLAEAYPTDPSVLVTLLLNRVRLLPGESIFLGPGNLHAYLSGIGVEIMGASDNVIRGGLTTKHVDVDELLSVLDFTPLLDPVVRPGEVSSGRWCYDTPHTPFRLWRYDVEADMAHTATGRELLLCTDGDVGVLARGGAAYMAPGESLTFTGRGTVFRVEEVDSEPDPVR
jgi:mannose-6-phosphate isomerase